MVIFRHVEFVQLGHFGDDGVIPNVLGVQILDQVLSDLLLLIVVIENRGAVLCAYIRALAVHRGGIMNREEDVQKVTVRNDIWIEMYLYHFGMSGIPVADFVIGRVYLGAT